MDYPNLSTLTYSGNDFPNLSPVSYVGNDFPYIPESSNGGNGFVQMVDLGGGQVPTLIQPVQMDLDQAQVIQPAVVSIPTVGVSSLREDEEVPCVVVFRPSEGLYKSSACP